MRILVTGAAGFIGGQVCRALADRSHDVVAIDNFDGTLYDPAVKIQVAAWLERERGLKVHRIDAAETIPETLWDGVDTVVNEAAVPGLVPSWTNFSSYVRANILAVQELAAAAVANGVSHFVQASTSSVYGRFARGDEGAPTQPFSPYGVSKLAGETVLQAYSANFDLPFTILRYYSVYGPGQRPDMAYHILCEKLLSGDVLTVYGDGTQSRTNTHVVDCVSATVSAVEHPNFGEIFNISGAESISLLDAIEVLAYSLEVTPRVEYAPTRRGDQAHTVGVTAKAQTLLKFEPRVPILEGLAEQADWHRQGRPAFYTSKWSAS